MVYGNVELYNTERIIEREGVPGIMLNRFSEEAAAGLDRGEDRRGPVTQAYCNDIEIRFESDDDSVTLHLGAWENDGYVIAFNGEHFNGIRHLPEGRISVVTFERHPRLALMPGSPDERFSRSIWRIVFLKRFSAVFLKAEGGIRPPVYSKMPPTLLAYGSSITFGAGTGPASYLHHMQILARKLGYQLMNKSMPGSCFSELSYGDFLSDIKADLFYYELGGNMRLRFTPEEFAKRAEHLIRETRRKNPLAKIFLVSVYPLLKSIPDEDHGKAARTIRKFDMTLEDLAAGDDCIYLIDGSEVINEPGLLSYDGLHPSGYGNIVMAERLYGIMKNLV